MSQQKQEALRGLSLKVYRVKCRIGDALLCQLFDGFFENPDPVLVAVNHESRMVASETVCGVTWDYTYELTDTLNPRRIARSEGVQRIEILHPAYPDGCEIQARWTESSGVSDSENQDIRLIEVSHRRWVKDRSDHRS